MSRSTYTLTSGSSHPGSQSTYALPATGSWQNNLHSSIQASSLSPIHQIASPTLNKNTGQINEQHISPTHNSKLLTNHKKLPKVAPKPKCSQQHMTGLINSGQVKNPTTKTSLGMVYNSPQPSNQQSNYPAQHTTIPYQHQLHSNTMSDTSPMHLSSSSANNSPLQQSSPAKLTPCHVLYSSEEVGSGSTRKTSPECVYLRPEQNIPDSFHTTKFKPISPANGSSGGSCSDHESSGDFNKHKEGEEEGHQRLGEFEGSGASSRKVYTSTDDIVLTLRSVQV